jgi:hypothetical protein
MARKLVLSLVAVASMASAAQAMEFRPTDPIEGDTVWLTYADRIAPHAARGECRTEHRVTRQRRGAETVIRVHTTVHGACGGGAGLEAQLLGKLSAGDYVVIAGGEMAKLHVRPANTDPGPLTDLQRIQLAVAQVVPISSPFGYCHYMGGMGRRALRVRHAGDWGVDQLLRRRLHKALPALGDAELDDLQGKMVRVGVTMTGAASFRYQIDYPCCDGNGHRQVGTGTLGKTITVDPPKMTTYSCAEIRPQ